MADDRDALLAAVRAAPDDDAPRLVFADWLDEHGEGDFAAFIRLEIEAARLPRDDPRRETLRGQARDLRKRLPDAFRAHGLSALTYRGFYYSVQCDPLELHKSLDRFGPYAPRLSILLTNHTRRARAAEEEAAGGGPDRIGEALRVVFASPWLRQCVGLETHGLRVTAGRARDMFGPGQLVGLDTLCFAGGADDDTIQTLADAQLPSLRWLGVHEIPHRDDLLLTPAALITLAQSPLLARLEELSLWGEWVENRGLQALARSPRAAGLKSLSLAPRGQYVTGLRALLESPHLAGLEALDVSWQRLGPQLAGMLARPDVLPGLTRLHVSEEDAAVHGAELVQRFGDGVLIGPVASDMDGPPRPVSAARFPYYELSVRILVPSGAGDQYLLARRIEEAATAALGRHNVGDQVQFHVVGTGGPGSYSGADVYVYDIRRAVEVLREVLVGVGVPADTTVRVRRRGSGIPLRTYPLAAQSEADDWGDLDEVERAARLPVVD